MSHRVLIVDDNSGLRKLIRMTLRMGDFELLEAENGEDALRAVRQHRPDAVVLDVMMPGQYDGYQVCEQIKTDAQLAGTQVLLLTARGQQADLDEGQRVSADSYMVKPFSPMQLIGTVRDLLAG